jgi:hypothetical protein
MTPALAVGLFLALTAQAEPPADVPTIQLLNVDAEALRVPGFDVAPRVPSIKRLALEVGIPALGDWVVTEVAIHRFGLNESNPLPFARTTLWRGVGTVGYTVLSVYLIRWFYKHEGRLAGRVARGVAIGAKVLFVVLNARTLAREAGR